MIIGLSGYIGSGKDTVGMLLQALTIEPENGSRWRNEPLEYVKAYDGRPNLKGGWQIRKFAAKLKKVASLLTGIPVEKFEDQEFKMMNLPSEWDYIGYTVGLKQDGPFGGKPEIKHTTVREFLQKLGTDAIRNNLHGNTWVNALFADYKPDSNWIITDVRFPNEAQAIKEKGGVVIRVDRFQKKHTSVGLHPSETGLDEWNFDYRIKNDRTLEDLSETVKLFMENSLQK